MNFKEYCFFNKIEYDKHQSSYFRLPAGIAVVLAYFLPGLLGMMNINFSYFASLVLIIVAVFEKKSELVKFYCYQYCFLNMVFNIFLSLLSLIGLIVPFIQPFQIIISLISAILVLFCTIYSLFCALQYKSWVIPWVGTFVLKTFFRK